MYPLLNWFNKQRKDRTIREAEKDKLAFVCKLVIVCTIKTILYSYTILSTSDLTLCILNSSYSANKQRSSPKEHQSWNTQFVVANSKLSSQLARRQGSHFLFVLDACQAQQKQTTLPSKQQDNNSIQLQAMPMLFTTRIDLPFQGDRCKFSPAKQQPKCRQTLA